ncbi:hypothetical protein [Oceanibaculum nanhaiense]|uniref:hypothetical protein n=1 Tax=Oceanibaculum nanhaiense TaxID=1909734 RepID=UPI003D2ABDB7
MTDEYLNIAVAVPAANIEPSRRIYPERLEPDHLLRLHRNTAIAVWREMFQQGMEFKLDSLMQAEAILRDELLCRLTGRRPGAGAGSGGSDFALKVATLQRQIAPRLAPHERPVPEQAQQERTYAPPRQKSRDRGYER